MNWNHCQDHPFNKIVCICNYWEIFKNHWKIWNSIIFGFSLTLFLAAIFNLLIFSFIYLKCRHTLSSMILIKSILYQHISFQKMLLYHLLQDYQGSQHWNSIVLIKMQSVSIDCLVRKAFALICTKTALLYFINYLNQTQVVRILTSCSSFLFVRTQLNYILHKSNF